MAKIHYILDVDYMYYGRITGPGTTQGFYCLNTDLGRHVATTEVGLKRIMQSYINDPDLVAYRFWADGKALEAVYRDKFRDFIDVMVRVRGVTEGHQSKPFTFVQK